MPGGTVEEDFPRLAAPHRGELLAHCYRMLGSVHDAEDLVQETYLRAWRSYDRFEGRSSLRTWLFRIATRVCLTALETRSRRPLPTGLGGPSNDPEAVSAERPEVPWLQPLPDAMVHAAGADPAVVVTHRQSTRLALVAALQLLPPRQRAVLVLRDVLGWSATETAHALGTSAAAVNSSLQRARAQLDRTGPHEDEFTEPTDRDQRELLDRYALAFENRDIAGIVEMFTEDVVWEMPPFTAWFRGPKTISRHLATQCPAHPGALRLVPTGANGQAAFVTYVRDADQVRRASAVQVLALRGTRISHIAMFFDRGLLPFFGLPATLPGGAPGPLRPV